MAYEELRRVLDQVKPTPDREKAMLEDLLREHEERMNGPMKKRRVLPRFAALAAAAALMATTCAFAVVTGLDQRLLGYFGGTPEQEALLSPAAVAVDKEIKDQGSTLHVRQVIADRYSAVILMDFTAPEGTVLDGDYYTLGRSHIQGRTADGAELSSWGFDWTLLEDEDPGDNRITLLYRVNFIDGDGNALGTTLTLDFTGLYDNNLDENCLVQGNWKFKVALPEADPGRNVILETPIEIEEKKVTLTSLYLSPISLAWELGEGKDDLEALDHSALHGRKDWPELITLTMEDGRELSPGEIKFMITQFKTDLLERDRGRYCFGLPEIIDPEAAVSVTIFGQSFGMRD